MNRLDWMDRPTGRVIRRIHTSRPGELVHLDTKQLGRIPPGGGWRAWGRELRDRQRARVGYAYVHAAIDAYSRVAYAEVLGDQRGETCAAFWSRAKVWFADRGVKEARWPGPSL